MWNTPKSNIEQKLNGRSTWVWWVRLRRSKWKREKLQSCRNLTNADGRKAASFAEPIGNRSVYTDNVSHQPARPISNRTTYATDNVSQQPAKRQLVTDRHDFISMDPNIVNHSPSWSLSDEVGPQVLDFSKRVARDAVQTSINQNNNPRASSSSSAYWNMVLAWLQGLIPCWSQVKTWTIIPNCYTPQNFLLIVLPI
jgi:hypothetical protein